MSFEDVNGDGLIDLVARFEIDSLQVTSADSIVVLTGNTVEGRPRAGAVAATARPGTPDAGTPAPGAASHFCFV